MVDPPCTRRTEAALREARFSHSSAVRRKAVRHVLGLKESLARLARTRRSVRSSRGRPLASGLQNARRGVRKFVRSRGIQHRETRHTLMLKYARAKNSNAFVRHVTSPL